jgi:hypothetical protein
LVLVSTKRPIAYFEMPQARSFREEDLIPEARFLTAMILGSSGPFSVAKSFSSRLKVTPVCADNSLVEGKEDSEWRK